ncbi:Nn.00g085730.m01.CDS01 [Neocucurbitaria sp. VM-36]
MQHPRHTKVPSQHLIFVKNVPTYLAKCTIPEIYNGYGALGVKNVYPDGSITTAVVSFRTFKDAVRAQFETDGMRLDNVILRVELYNKQRSVRIIREIGSTKRPLGDIMEDYENAQEEEGYNTGSKQTPFDRNVASTLPHDAIKDTTWAHVVANNKPTPTTVNQPKAHRVVLPGKAAPRVTAGAPHVQLTHKSTPVYPHWSRISDEDPSSDSRTVPSPTAKDSNTPDKTDFEGDGLRDQLVEATTKAVGVPQDENALETIDTTERIRRRHCKLCFFCQLRKRC